MGRGRRSTSLRQVVNLLRQIEVAVANGKTTPQACKDAGIVEQTYFRWRKEYGGLQVDQAKRLKELEQGELKAEAVSSEPKPRQPCVEGFRLGNFLAAPERRRIAADHAQQKAWDDGAAELCRLANQPRGTQRYRAIRREDEDALTHGDRPACQSIRSLWVSPGSRRLLKRAELEVGKDQVERSSGVARGSRFRRSRSHEDGCGSTMSSCVRLRPTHRNHVWSYDFVSARTHDGRSVRLLNLIDEHTRESLLVRGAQRRWSSSRVISALADVMVMKGVPEHLRSDNGPEFVAKDLRNWLWPTQEQRRCTSSLALRGRTATARASTLSSGMNF